MEREHKSYGYEGGYEDWTADKVYKNMRIMQDGKQVADVEETEDIGEAEGDRSLWQRESARRSKWHEEDKEDNRPTSRIDEDRGW